jgi:adenylate kinase family enzyme
VTAGLRTLQFTNNRPEGAFGKPRNPNSMKVAVFGKPGGGKSTLAQQIATMANLPLQQVDLLQYEKGGAKVSDEEFLRRYAEALAQQHWVVDGFGNPLAFEAMLRAADVLVYIERSSLIHYWWVTKRFLKSPLVKPLGWPKDSPMLRSTISSYRFLRLSDRFWTPAFKAKLLALRPGKRVYVIRRQSDVLSLLAEFK